MTRVFGFSMFLAAAFGAVAALAAEAGRATITSDTTFYDRKEGIVVFTGNVKVDDAEYQLHSNRAFVFLEGTNELKRIVATGNVALTNESRRAYASKATYRKDSGLVVLYGEEGRPAEVRDEGAKGGDQVVKGKKIRFWINQEQVEVEGADVSAPVGGMKDIKTGILKN